MAKRVLISWTGRAREPFAFSGGRSTPGAHIQLLRDSEYAGTLDMHYLLTVPETMADAHRLVSEMSALPQPVSTEPQVLRLVNPTDTTEILHQVGRWMIEQDDNSKFLDHELYVLLNTGTPQMQAAWILLHVLGLVQLRIIQTTPPDIAEQSEIPEVREAEFDLSTLESMFEEVQARQQAH